MLILSVVRLWIIVACRDGISCVEFVVADWCLVDTRVPFGTRVRMVRMDMELKILEVKKGCTCEVCKSCCNLLFSEKWAGTMLKFSEKFRKSCAPANIFVVAVN